MLVPSRDTGGASGKRAEEMRPCSDRRRACGRDTKNRKRCVGLGGLLQQGAGKGAFEVVKQVQRPWGLAGHGELAGLALVLLSPVFSDPLEYGAVSALTPRHLPTGPAPLLSVPGLQHWTGVDRPVPCLFHPQPSQASGARINSASLAVGSRMCTPLPPPPPAR